MTDFKAGDRVKCVRPLYRGSLVSGAVYTVTRVLKDDPDDINPWVWLKEVKRGGVDMHDGKEDAFLANRFVKVNTSNGWDWIEAGARVVIDKPREMGEKGPEPMVPDVVAFPSHYRSHPSGVECITITQHMNFCRGNAVKYVWRAGEKGGKEKEIEDLRKARQYLDIEIARLEAAK